MKKILLIGTFAFSPLFANAGCFKVDTSKLNKSNINDFAVEVLSTVDYSTCTANELAIAKDGMQAFGENQAKQMQGNDWATKSSSNTYLALAKSSLALIQQELIKRK